MSILVALDHKEEPEEERDEELLVFGYACRLYNDAETALKEDTGALLIPWMGERPLMIDRCVWRARGSPRRREGRRAPPYAYLLLLLFPTTMR